MRTGGEACSRAARTAAGEGDLITTFHPIPFFHKKRCRMPVHGYKAIMLNRNRVESKAIVDDVLHDTVCGCTHGGALQRADIDTFVDKAKARFVGSIMEW